MSFCLWVDLSKSCFSQVRYNLNRSNLLRRDGSTFTNILSLHLDASIPHAFGQFAAQNISACVIDAQHDFQSVVRDTFAVLRQITCCVETIIYHDYCALFLTKFRGGRGWNLDHDSNMERNRWFSAEVIRKSLRLCKALWMLDFWHIATWLRFFFHDPFWCKNKFGGPKPLGGNFWFCNNSFSTTFVWVSNYSHHLVLVNLFVGFGPPGRPIGTPHWDEFWCREGRPEGAAMRVLRNEAGFHVRLEALHQCRGLKDHVWL